MKTKDIVNISLFTTLLVVCAWIYIPTTVPFTMQTFAVFLAMIVLGGKRGIIVIYIYVLLGSIGVPVFAGGTTGLGVLLGATGGYMIGWIFLGIFVSCIEKILTRYCEKDKGINRACVQIATLIVGLGICYVFGTFWFVSVYGGGNSNTGFWSAFSICVLPFIIPDCIKLALAYSIGKRLKRFFFLDSMIK